MSLTWYYVMVLPWRVACTGDKSGAPCLEDKVFVVQAGSRGFDYHRRHMSKRFFGSKRPGNPHPMCSELENSGIRVTVGDCRLTERRRWRPSYQTGKAVHVHAKHYKYNEEGKASPAIVYADQNLKCTQLDSRQTAVDISIAQSELHSASSVNHLRNWPSGVPTALLLRK